MEQNVFEERDWYWRSRTKGFLSGVDWIFIFYNNIKLTKLKKKKKTKNCDTCLMVRTKRPFIWNLHGKHSPALYLLDSSLIVFFLFFIDLRILFFICPLNSPHDFFFEFSRKPTHNLDIPFRREIYLNLLQFQIKRWKCSLVAMKGLSDAQYRWIVPKRQRKLKKGIVILSCVRTLIMRGFL